MEREFDFTAEKTACLISPLIGYEQEPINCILSSSKSIKTVSTESTLVPDIKPINSLDIYSAASVFVKD